VRGASCDTGGPSSLDNNNAIMTKQEIKQAISGIAQLLGSNPEMMKQQLGMLKALAPDLDEAAMNKIVEKAQQPGFNPRQLETELESIVSSIKSASAE